jgi:ABC-2 type transport system ATP-binding protein
MITVSQLTKRFGSQTAVDDLSFEVQPGRVTGFLGPNGAGKSTTMRVILGLDRPDSGTALINGKPYSSFRHPLSEVGAALEARAAHPGRKAYHHLLGMARSNGIPASRVGEVLETVGLAEVAQRRVGTYSLGMSQRLAIAAALLGDPQILLLDEPINGLDPDGVRWVRQLIRGLAAEGRTLFVSSHLMSEMEDTADHLVVIGRGRLIADAPIQQVIGASSLNAVTVRSPQAEALRQRLEQGGMQATLAGESLLVTGGTMAEIGDVAFQHQIPVHELSLRLASLEEAYMELTASAVQYAAPSANRKGE